MYSNKSDRFGINEKNSPRSKPFKVVHNLLRLARTCNVVRNLEFSVW